MPSDDYGDSGDYETESLFTGRNHVPRAEFDEQFNHGGHSDPFEGASFTYDDVEEDAAGYVSVERSFDLTNADGYDDAVTVASGDEDDPDDTDIYGLSS